MWALDPAYGAAVLPFPDALLRLPRLRALSLQIPCVVGIFIPSQMLSGNVVTLPVLHTHKAATRDLSMQASWHLHYVTWVAFQVPLLQFSQRQYGPNRVQSSVTCGWPQAGYMPEGASRR